MAKRRDAADRKSRRLAHIGGVRTLQRLADLLRGDIEVDPVGAGDQQQVGLPELTPRKTSDLTIWPTSQPQAAAASSAVRVVFAMWRTLQSSPLASRAAWTRCAAGLSSRIAETGLPLPLASLLLPAALRAAKSAQLQGPRSV